MITIVRDGAIVSGAHRGAVVSGGRAYPPARLEADQAARLESGGYLSQVVGAESPYRMLSPSIDAAQGVVTWEWVSRSVVDIAEIKRAEIVAAADAAIDAETGGSFRPQLRAVQKSIAIINRRGKGSPRPEDETELSNLEAMDAAVEAAEAHEQARLGEIAAAELANDIDALIAIEW